MEKIKASMDRAYLITWILGIVGIIGIIIVIASLSIHPQIVISQEKQIVKQTTGVTLKPIPQKIFTLEQISVHNNSSDCWIVVNKFVYDITSLIKQSASVIAASEKNFNAGQFCGRDQTIAISGMTVKFGIKDLNQLNAILSQYATGRVK